MQHFLQHLMRPLSLKLNKVMAPTCFSALLALAATVSIGIQSATAQSANPNEAVFLNKSVDREAWLLERAKKRVASRYTPHWHRRSQALWSPSLKRNTASR